MRNRVAAIGWKAGVRLIRFLARGRLSGKRLTRSTSLGHPSQGPPADTLRLSRPLASYPPSCPPQGERLSALVVGLCENPAGGEPAALAAYLRERENPPGDIAKVSDLLRMPKVLLEIGCGAAEAARLIALANPAMGVIATDRYDRRPAAGGDSGYSRIAGLWFARRLPAQQDACANLVVLRAEADLLHHLPPGAIDTILMIHPEPCVGRHFLDLLRKDGLAARIRQGATRIVILPYSREMGIMACGGCSFEHDPDWSRGLGFIMDSGLPFQRATPIQWGVNLARTSAYTGNSTQSDLYICGDWPD